MIPTPYARRRRDLGWAALCVALAQGLTDGAAADDYFDPAALEGNRSATAVDLSRFERGGQAPGVYSVHIFVNGQSMQTREVTFDADDGNRLRARLTREDLRKLGVRVDALPALARLPPDQVLDDLGHYIPQAKSTLDFSRMRLDLSIPQAALQTTARGYVSPDQWDQGITALWTDYGLNAATTRYQREGGSSDDYYLNLRNGANFGAWRLRNNSTITQNADGYAWDSVDTYLYHDVQHLQGQFMVGDVATSSAIFDSVRFRGLQLASDSNMLPDSLKGFAPVVRGVARSNAQVTVRQSGYIIYQTYVPPGPFAIGDLYPTASAGDLQVTIEEEDGSSHSFTQPFASVAIMQREGEFKYALTLGRYRTSYDDGDTPEFGQATAIYGLPGNTTLYGGLLGSPDYLSAVAGIGYSLGEAGAISVDVTQADSTIEHQDYSGQSYRFRYSKTFAATDTTLSLANLRYSTEGFYTFADATDFEADHSSSTESDEWRTSDSKRSRLQLDLSQSLGDYGALYVSGYQQSYWQHAQVERNLSVGYNLSYRGISYNLSYDQMDAPGSDDDDGPSDDSSGDKQLTLSISLPLDRVLPHSWLRYGVTTQQHAETRQQIGLNGTALANNQLSYSLEQDYSNHGVGGSSNASLDYSGRYGEVNAGYSYSDYSQRLSYGARGGLLLHEGGMTFSQSPGETFALVEAPGTHGAEVDNRAGVATDTRGYTVVPNLNSYRENRIALKPETLGKDVDADLNVQTLVPTRGAVVRAAFKTRTGRRAILRLLEQDAPVPFGAEVRERQSHNAAVVGADGEAYLSGLPDKGVLDVHWGKTGCVADFDLAGARELGNGVHLAVARCRQPDVLLGKN